MPIEVKFRRADGTEVTRSYKNVDEWREDVEKDRAAGIPRLSASNSFWDKFDDDKPIKKLKKAPLKREPDKMSTAGLEDAGKALSKRFKKLRKKTKKKGRR